MLKTYLVWRKSAMNGTPYPEIWHDVEFDPKSSPEHGASVVKTHLVSEELKEEFTSLSTGFTRSQKSLVTFLAEKFPAPKDKD